MSIRAAVIDGSAAPVLFYFVCLFVCFTQLFNMENFQFFF